MELMTRNQAWMAFRPFVAAVLAVTAWIVAMLLTSLFPETDLGKGLSDRGFIISGMIFLILLLLITHVARLRWWDCVVPVFIPLSIAGFDITNYWTGRVWMAFIMPILISVAFATFRNKGLACTGGRFE